MSDERRDSLAAQAASWVPPWERQQPPLNRDFQAANPDEPDSVDQPGDDEKIDEADLAEDDDDFDEAFEGPNPPGYTPNDTNTDAEPQSDAAPAIPSGSDSDSGTASPSPSPSASPTPSASASSSPSAPSPSPSGTASSDSSASEESEGVPPELPPIPGESSEPATVDAPTELEGDSVSPLDVGVGPDIDVPASIEEASEDADDETGDPVDAPLPPDGDDAGDVFDAAADDDVSDDDDVDLPFTEDVPADDEDPAEDAGENPAEDPDGDTAEGADEDPAEDADGDAAEDVDDDPAERADGDLGERAGADSDDPGDSGGDSGERLDAGLGGVAAGRVAGAGGVGAGMIPGQGRRARAEAVAVEAAETRTPEEFDLAPIGDTELRAALEAILLVVDEPVAEMQLAQIVEQPTERVAALLDDISARYTAAGHGFDLRRAAGGWRLYTRPEYAPYVERFVLDGQSVRLTQAALETLSVVAYKQPVTRSRISAIRGVNCDGVMRTLTTRGLIEECGTEGETGAYLYRTTGLFLEKLGLNSVDQLPPLAPFLPDDVEEVLDASG